VLFLGNNYTGAYRDIPVIVDTLHSHGIAIAKTMTAGSPNHYDATTTHENMLLYCRKGNHPSIKAKINQVMSTMNKEEQHNYIIDISHCSSYPIASSPPSISLK
jgi:hypothetical protein